MDPNQPNSVCLVLVPFGVKILPDTGASVDFDAIYEGTIRPALLSAGVEAVRLDLDAVQQTSARERVLEADLLLVDVTTRDSAILFLLGARAQRVPGGTLVMAARGSETQLVSVPDIHVVVYNLDGGNGLTSRESARLRRQLSAALSEFRQAQPATFKHPGQSTVPLSSFAAAPLIETARKKRDVQELKRWERSLKSDEPDSALLLNIFQAYESLAEWEALVSLFNDLPPQLQGLPRVRQQAALALNRLGQRDQARQMLTSLLSERGPDSETYGLLGSIYKDAWLKSKDPADLDRAIDAYIKGFEANRKDAYPAINAVRLLEIRGDARSLGDKDRLLPLVSATVQDQIKLSSRPTYWDHATLLELAVLSGDEYQARNSLTAARDCDPESWQTETSAENLDLLREARNQRGQSQPWLDQIIMDLRATVTV